MPWVWFIVAAVVLFICAGALASIIQPPGIEGDQLRIHRILSDAEVEYGPNPLSPNKAAVVDAITSLEKLEIKDVAAKGTRARALLVLRQLADPKRKPDFAGLSDKFDDRDALARSADSSDDIAKVNASLKSLYGAADITDEQRARINKTLVEMGARWPLDIAARKLPDTNRAATGSEISVGLAFIAALLVGTACLIWIFVSPGINQVPLAGSSATGDNLGARFLLFMLVFLLVRSTIASFFKDLAVAAVVSTGTLAVLLIMIVGLFIKGRAFNSRQIGLRTDNLGKDIAYGVAGFFANIPAIIVLIVIGMTFLRWIPSGGHPIQYELFSSNLPLLILAVGPLTGFVEELAFRGLLFQGLTLRYGLRSALVLSSLAFAMIHPQGGALWLVLAWIGGMGAYLTYKRSSLIPAIIMHALHNSAIVTIAVFAMGE
jgi:membrane protease YdiL (CAAX protease family)